MSDICTCGRVHHPRTLAITPGSHHIDRHVGDAASFRAALLAACSADSRLAQWTSREPSDLGILLVEMWSGACAIVAFADETGAHESYLRTARQAVSIEHLIGLLGARPRGAVAALADVSFQASGRRPITVPAGTRLRSGAVDEHPPQVFELLRDVVVHPLTNGFEVDVRPTELVDASGEATTLSTMRALQEGSGLRSGALLMVALGDAVEFVNVSAATPVRGPGPTRVDVTMSPPLVMPAGTQWAGIELHVADTTDRLWTVDVGATAQPGLEQAPDGTWLTLESLSRRHGVGDDIVVSRGGDRRWFTVDAVTVAQRQLTADIEYEVDDEPYRVAGAMVPATRLRLDVDINADGRRSAGFSGEWDDGDAATLVVHGRWRRVGTPEIPTQTAVAAGVGALPLDAPDTGGLDQPEPAHHPARFAIVDRDGRAVSTTGMLDWSNAEVEIDHDVWEPPLRHPIRVDANVATASRGESVVGEILGDGDAATVNQRFELANGPLTHLGPDATGSGLPATSTLVVRVNGLAWTEVPSFVRATSTDRVFVAEPMKDGNVAVVFGDGIAGARLPSGTANVVADYRFGGGAIHPPADSIVQLVEPVERITGVVNRAAAIGGADPESADSLRTHGPASALLLDRAISIADFEAAIATAPGVAATAASYEWEPGRQRSAVVVRYIGDPALASGLCARVRGLAERSAAVSVVASPAALLRVHITLVADPKRIESDVEAALLDALLGEGGALTPGGLGVDGPVVRSRLLGTLVAVTGVDHVVELALDGTPFLEAARRPASGAHFDATASLTIAWNEVMS